MNNNLKVAAVVVLYNPESDKLQNIKSLITQVDYLYIVDNSVRVNKLLLEELRGNDKVDNTVQLQNLGIAHALNLAAQKAILKGYELLITMDQDSKVTEGMVAKLLIHFPQLLNPGIISPRHINANYKTKNYQKDIEEVQAVMTSGNLMNLKAYQLVGGFDENLFIDYVDIDLCFKLTLNNYKIYRINSISLEHKEGNLETVKLFNKTIRPYNHKPIRWYYKIRNYNYIKKKYYQWFPEYFKEEKKRIIRDLIKIILFEKQKFAKLNFVIKGYFDYKKGIHGKCPHLLH